MGQLIAFLWLLWPLVLLCQAGRGLWRRSRLFRNAVPVKGEIAEIWTSGEIERTEDAQIVDLVVVYRVGDRVYTHRHTRTDHQKQKYQLGGNVELIHECSRPANVIEVGRRPWDDVIGPLVFSLLLLAFMGWVLLFVGGLR